MHNYGDITNIKGSEVPIVDIVTGGSPCQDLSVAGKRAGLAGERSGLFMEQIRLIKEMRDEYRRTNDDGRNVSPRYMVWENVAGAFSSNKGEDFRAVLEETAKVTDENAVIPEPPKGKWIPCGCILGDGWSIAWRVHDAQFWGVPQRRKRICLLADFNGHSAGKILFELRRETHGSHTKQTVMDTRKESRSEVQSESSCVSRDSESCRTSGEGTSEDAEGCSHTSGGAISFQERAGKPGGEKGILIQNERTGALSTLNNQPVCYGVVTKGNGDAFINPNTHTSLSIGGGQAGQGYPCVLESKCLNPWDVQSKHIQPEDGIAESLYSGECRYGGGESYVLQNQQAMAMETFHCTSEVEKVQTLKARDYKDPQVICFEPGAASRVGGHVDEDGIAYSVRANAGDNQQAVVYGICSDGSNSMKSSNPHSGIYEADTSRTLDLNGGNPTCNQGGMAVVQGADLYNGTISGDIAVSLNTNTNATGAGPTVVCLEGNGSRESHKGDGYKESETMYTLNTVEQHGVCYTYRKKGHPQNSEQGQGWEETDVNDTLNVYDNSENRTPTIIVEESTENRPIIERRVYDWHRCDTRMTELGDVCCTASAAWGTGGNNVPMVMENTVVFTQNQRDEVRDLNGIAVGLQAERGTHQQNYIMETYQEPILLESNQNHATIQTDGISTALPASMGMGGGYVPMVVDTYQETTGALCASGYDKLGTQEAMNDMYVVQSSNWDGTQVAPTLTANNANGAQRMPDKDNFNAVVQTYKKKNNAGEYDSGIGTLKASGGDYGGGSETLVTTYQNTTGTICEAISKGTSNQIAEQDQLITNSIVRRLTPKECERLQGFPDDWTNIGEWVDESGKKHKNADSHRYKALGNSIALPFWQWLADRMVAQLKEDGVENPTMASLFDGIGGFPLVFSRSGCKPMWISEIENFPIAVTRVRFPNEEVN